VFGPVVEPVVDPVVGLLVGPVVEVDAEVEPEPPVEVLVGVGILDGEVVSGVWEAEPLFEVTALPHAVNCKLNTRRAITTIPKRCLPLDSGNLLFDNWFKLKRDLKT
jgi:hypothetical protein